MTDTDKTTTTADVAEAELIERVRQRLHAAADASRGLMLPPYRQAEMEDNFDLLALAERAVAAEEREAELKERAVTAEKEARAKSLQWAEEWQKRSDLAFEKITLASRIAELTEALERARARFEEYADNHAAKSPPDWAKAARNIEMVEICDATLAKAKAVLG